MKKFFLFAAALVAAMTINAQEPNVVVLSDVANYIDFQALSVSDADMTKATVTSTAPYELKNGSVLKGFLKSDGSEAANTWNVKEKYDTTMPTPDWEGVDSLTAGTMFRAASGTTIELGAFKTTDAGKMVVYFQPNGDSERGISVTILGGDPIEVKKSGAKINAIRPAYAAEFDLAKGQYDKGDIIIKLIANTSNIFGVRIEKLEGSAINNVAASVKAQKIFRNGQVLILKDGVYYNMLGSVAE